MEPIYYLKTLEDGSQVVTRETAHLALSTQEGSDVVESQQVDITQKQFEQAANKLRTHDLIYNDESKTITYSKRN